MTRSIRFAAAAGAVFALAGCVGAPVGPSVIVPPGPGRTAAAYEADQAACRAEAAVSGYNQPRYDSIFMQCMAARGNVPAPYAFAPGPEVSLVTATQGELSRLMYLTGAVDGVPGPQTTDAIRRFQRTHGMPVDGRPSGELLDMLRRTPPGY